MVSDKYADLRKTENFIRSKCYPEDISKDKRRRANFRKSCKNFKIVDGHLIYKGKKSDDRILLIPQYHSILP